MKYQPLVLASCVLLSTSLEPASAGILTDMNQLVMSNSSAPSSLSTANRVGVFGGSLELRAPTTAVHLVAFDPPRLDAGCGGVDLYGGSFSFINSAQLVQIFRSVAANAEGLAFKAAISAISPSLDKLITEFQTLMQNMNNLAKNSCQMAHLVVNGGEQALGLQVNADGSIGSAATGMVTDIFASLTSYLSDANSYFNKAGEVNPKAGNTNMKAILASGSSAILGVSGLPNFDSSTDDATDPNSLNNKLLISVMGYEVNGVPCAHSNQDGTADTTTATANANLGNLTCSGAPTITLKDLVDGGGTGSANTGAPLKLYACANPSGYGLQDSGAVDAQVCTSMQTTDFNYPGIRGYINTALFGNVDPQGTITAASILGQMGAGTSVTLTASQYQFLNTTGIPLIPLLAKTSNPAIRVSIAQRLAEQVVSCVAASVGEAIYKAAIGTQNGGQNNLSSDTKKNIAQLRSDFMHERGVCTNNSRVLQIAQELNEATRLVAGNVH